RLSSALCHAARLGNNRRSCRLALFCERELDAVAWQRCIALAHDLGMELCAAIRTVIQADIEFPAANLTRIHMLPGILKRYFAVRKPLQIIILIGSQRAAAVAVIVRTSIRAEAGVQKIMDMAMLRRQRHLGLLHLRLHSTR